MSEPYCHQCLESEKAHSLQEVLNHGSLSENVTRGQLGYSTMKLNLQLTLKKSCTTNQTNKTGKTL